jgi:hypothetical protein
MPEPLATLVILVAAVVAAVVAQVCQTPMRAALPEE